MARTPIMAAGGIVLRREQPPRIAVVRLRKRDEWVLPKGKLDDGETPRDAAKREVLEETGHKVTVHEFLGTLVHDTGTRSKVVHYWRMEATGTQTQPLMDDVRAVDWLPLDAAVERLSRDHEKTFLETVGPYALAGLIRKAKAKPAQEPKAAVEKPAVEKAADVKAPLEKPATEKPAMAKKRRSRAAPQSVPSELPAVPPAVVEPVEAIPQAIEIMEATPEIASEPALDASSALDRSEPTAAQAALPPQTEPAAAPEPAAPERVPADLERVEAVAAAIKSLVPSAAEPVAQAGQQSEDAPKPESEAEPQDGASAEVDSPDGRGRRSLAQKMRAWLGRAA
ncbi:putative NUDIX hydrolase (modular protein) [Bradyrhizobium sp. ORS 285]|uniref:NUDIX hydrolase n=1 Tax=Bradyrhizobium sp. ORS 285 TaxID=115808 RepID=UPI00024094DA|nr:NUDIX hydrolase [Bradyrhizobium sp. ORS 285]CCD86900.1 putative NUDIX hydrolase (modular protein) [Bradyrhizobium sp. ORS 285]SMX60452.1 putative NUDIX hydrolase (modular protein) [Bradyrhizobium sp. ORS 285]